MSNAPQQPKQDWPPPEGEQGQDEMRDHLMGRAQESEHVQSRFSNLHLTSSPDARGIPGGRPPSLAGAPAAPAPKGPREEPGTLPPTTEGGSWRAAAAMRLGAAGFGLMAAVLFTLPVLTGSFQVPPAEVLLQPTYTTLAPTFDTPAPPKSLDEVITEQSAAFDGASILVVDSEPGGVNVIVDGNDQGGTPMSLTLDCLPGKPIKVELSRRGYERAKHTTFCRTNTMIKLHARMRKVAKGSGGKR